jgi:hypothetical protein
VPLRRCLRRDRIGAVCATAAPVCHPYMPFREGL